MRTFKLFSCAIFLAIATVSCNKEAEELKLDNRYVNLTVAAGSGQETKSEYRAEFFKISDDEQSLFITATSSRNYELPFADAQTKGSIISQSYVNSLGAFEMYMAPHYTESSANEVPNAIGSVIKESGADYWSFRVNGEKVLWPDDAENGQIYSFTSIIGDPGFSMSQSREGDVPMKFTSFKDKTVQYYGIKSNGATDAERMSDVLVAYNIHQHNHNDQANDLVKLDFYHPLTAVRFRVTSTVTKITIAQAKKGGILIYGQDGDFIWDTEGSEDDDNLTTYVQEINDNLKTSYKDASGNDLYEAVFFLVPQNFNDTDIIVTFDIVDQYGKKHQISTKANNLGVKSENGVKGWKSGWIYNYYVEEDAESKVGIQVNETFQNYVKKNVYVMNTMRSTAYIRATVVANWIAADKIIAPYDIENNIEFNVGDDSRWAVGTDGYFYYLDPVRGFDVTDDLISEFSDDSSVYFGLDAYHLEMRIIAQGVEYDSLKEYFTAAWPDQTTIISRLTTLESEGDDQSGE